MRRRYRLLGLLTGMVLAAGALFAVTVLRDHARGEPVTAQAAAVSWGRTAVDANGLAERSGVRITQVAVTGGGGLLDLRFQVLDPNRANALHDPATPPAVIDERTGLVIHDLFMNHAHTDPYKAGVTYYLVFVNPGDRIHRGTTVSVLLGTAQVEHVPVR